ncbi:GNAT family acetyltransferase [Dongia sedimenti]|uniref:GNAT family acetyltransferase n=1 Tax=Dongia sedimenti TaxID=3064282 RepID=A0ABU0YV50_9PROT|nr:GNAT family acetyltransferase [Rhodospirillaceae bacterium R-7]
MIILPYSERDFDGVAALWRDAGILKPYNDPKVEIARIQKNNNCLLYIGRDGDRIVASVLVGHDGYRGWLHKVAVAEDQRGKGYGRKLVQFAEAWLVARGMPKINLMVRAENPAAREFYQHLGYENAGHAVLGRWLDKGDVDLASAEIDVVITYMEMTAPPTRPTVPLPPGKHALLRVESPTIAFYRFLYNTVGEQWLWTDRRRMPDEKLLALVDHPEVELYVLYTGGQPSGFVELDRRPKPELAFAYFGLMNEFIGRGLGKYLLNWAVDQAWSYGPEKLTVDTCTLDHPRAIGEYQRAGFRPVRQVQKRMLDPRLEGYAPMHVIPRLPEVATG